MSSRPAAIDIKGLQGILLRREPTRLGGVITVLLMINGREVEVIRDRGDLVDHCATPTSIKDRIEKGAPDGR